MDIPFMDLAAQHREVWEDLHASFEKVLAESSFALGPAVQTFEEEFAEFCDVDHCAGLSSGTAALHLALRTLDVGPGDEVITTPLTFIASVWPISYLGASPVFVDVEPETCTIDPSRLEGAVTDRTKVILPVHLYGHPAPMDPILKVADRHELFVVEDAAQAHGAAYRGRPCGSMGKVGCFSFYPSKNLGACGEAGAVVTSDPVLDARIRSLRDHAQEKKHVHRELGYNYRMDGLQGAALRVKLERLRSWNGSRRRVATRYREHLADLPEVTLPVEREEARHVYHLYVVRLPSGEARDALRNHLERRGVGTGLHYPTPVHLQPAYRHLDHGRGSFPRAERAADRVLSLPMHPHMTDDQARNVAAEVRAFFGDG